MSSLSVRRWLAVDVVFSMAAALLAGAIATSPNRTGRSRTATPYLVVQVGAFASLVVLPLLLL